MALKAIVFSNNALLANPMSLGRVLQYENSENIYEAIFSNALIINEEYSKEINI